MLRILINLIKSPKSFFNRPESSRFCINNLLAMSGESVKNKSGLNMEHLPVKKIKLTSDDEVDVVQTRTVATMCGAWRPDEVDGGLIFVFKTREACLSPDPTKECDYPENIEDFWEASLMTTDDIQVCFICSLTGIPIY